MGPLGYSVSNSADEDLYHSRNLECGYTVIPLIIFVEYELNLNNEFELWVGVRIQM